MPCGLSFCGRVALGHLWLITSTAGSPGREARHVVIRRDPASLPGLLGATLRLWPGNCQEPGEGLQSPLGPGIPLPGLSACASFSAPDLSACLFHVYLREKTSRE